jgi:hypothetical protein
MKTFRSFFGIFFLTLSFIFLCGSIETVRSDDWKLFYESPDGSKSYYSEKLVKQKDVVQVQTKDYLSDDQKKKVMEMRKNDRLPVNGWDRLSYNEWLTEIDCKERRARALKGVSYDNNGKVLDSSPSDWKGEWRAIPPGSAIAIENLFQKVCSK